MSDRDDAMLDWLDRADKRTGEFDTTPKLFSNFVPSTAQGAARGVTRAAFLARAGSAIIGDRLRGDGHELGDTVFSEMESAVDYLTPDPVTTGTASQISGGVLEFLAPLALSGGNPGIAAAGTAGVAFTGPTTDLIRQGVDTNTAVGVGSIYAGATLVGFRIPFAGKSLATRMASGVAGNVAVDVPAEFGASGLLKSQGYEDQAQAYGPTWESTALAALMGAGFGGYSHYANGRAITQADRDAILTANSANQFANDSMPGTPRTVEAATRHQADLATAIKQILDGEPVNVQGDLSGFDLRPELQLRPQAPDVPGYDSILVALESGGDASARAPTSSATGLHQFTDGTWLNTVAQARPAWAEGLDRAQLLAARTDPAKSAEMERVLRAENAAALERAGQTASTWNLYAAHHFGAGKGVAFAKAAGDAPMASILSAGQLKANPYLSGLTKDQAVANWRARAMKAGAMTPSQYRDLHAPFEPDVAAARARAEIESLADTPEQVRAGLAKEFEAAAQNKPEFDEGLMSIAEELDLSRAALLPDQLKGAARAAEKVVFDYNGDATRLRDIVRGTLVLDRIDQVEQALGALTRRFGEPSKVRNTLRPDAPPTSPDGYRDVNTNVVLNGRNVEVQLNVPAMLRAKDKAHPLYEEVRAIEARASKEDRNFTSAEVERINALNASQREIYDSAWTEATSESNRSRVMGSPSRQNEVTGNLRGSGVSQARHSSESGTSETGMPSTSRSSAFSGTFETDISATSTGILPRNQPGQANATAAQTTRSDTPPEGRAAAGSAQAGPGAATATAGKELDPARFPVQGADTTVVTERGLQVRVRYAVTDVGALVTSHDDALNVNPEFPAELQPRDRARAASAQQIARIANNLNPALLADSPKAADGAPIVGPDAVVESGNARTIAVRRAYQGGKADVYRQFLVDEAERFGLDPAAVDGVAQPMLVRVALDEARDRAEFARQANEQTVAGMSATEQALADARNLPDMGDLVTNDDGTINMRASGRFVQGFIEQAVGPNERATMATAAGDLSQQGQARIRSAVFARAYGDPDLVAMMAEATDANVKNVLAGMLRAAPRIARLREMIAEGGRYGPDLAPDLVMAVRKFSQLRSEGTTVEAYEAQGDFFGAGGLTPKARDLLRTVGENARAPKRMAEFLGRYVDAVEALGDPRQADLMGGAKADPTEVAAAATREANEPSTMRPGADMFGVGRRPAAAQEATAPAITPDNRAAYEAIAAMPDLQVMGEDGVMRRADEYLAEGEADAARAAEEVRAVTAAADCFTRTAA